MNAFLRTSEAPVLLASFVIVFSKWLLGSECELPNT